MNDIFCWREFWRSASFTELAQELQIGYKGAAAIYYRALSRIREKLEEET